jgi:hypothetical protein
VYELRPHTTNRSRNATASPPPSSVFNRDSASLDNPPAISRLEHRRLAGRITRQELSQTQPLPGIDPAPLEPPRRPLTGDSHAHLIEPLVAFGQSLGFTVAFEPIAGSAGGWCDQSNKRIVVDADAPANARVRALIHECAHALGIDYRSYSRAQAEVMVETVTLLAASAVGLAVDGETIPYVAGWGEDGALDGVTAFAETIDTIARRIESAIAPSSCAAGASSEAKAS